MIQLRLVIILLFILKPFSNSSFAQTKIPNKSEIKRMADQAIKFRSERHFEKSIGTARMVLNYATAIHDNSLVALSYNTIAANLNELSEFDKAIYYYKKGLHYANLSDNDSIKNFINNNLGNVYCFEKKQYKKGIAYYKKSLEYSQKSKDTTQLLFTKLNIIWAYFDIGLYEKGLPYLEFLNKYNSKLGKLSTIATLDMLNGMYYSYKGEKVKANSYFVEAIKQGQKSNDESDLSYAHFEYSKFLQKNGEYKQAYENLAIYNSITEKIYNSNKLAKANVVGVNFQLDEYRRDVGKIEYENKMQAESIKKSRIIVALFITFLIVLLLLLYSLYRSFQYKKKRNIELTLSNELLLIAKQKAEEGAIAKTQFISTISHELRTPLFGVIGITNMLADEHKELVNSPHLKSLKFSASYLLSLINDILHINKIEEKKLVLENLTFNIWDELEMIINSLSFLAHSFENTITLKIDKDIPEYLIGDKLRLSQILMNLISNAIKFTKNGYVKIDVNLLKIEEEICFVEFIIEDNGVGIAPVNQDRIFEKFVQVGRNKEDYQGTGLGLAIVKTLLELFNSEISVESAVGVGTTFKFIIGFESEVQKPIQIEKLEIDSISSHNFKILVVEDNKINQLITKRIIEKNKCTCIVVEDGFQAIEIVKEQVFDIILMDINMPLINGFETSRRIRQSGIVTPIIALTAFAKDEIAEEAIDSGMNDIMIKPFEAALLFKIINHQIEKSRNVIANAKYVS